MSDLDASLRNLVRDLVREELAKVGAEAKKPDAYLSTAAAAKLADVATGTIRRWIREGRLLLRHAGRELRVKRSDLENLMCGMGGDHDLTPEQVADRDSR